MPTARPLKFKLNEVRVHLQQTLEQAGYDLIADPNEPNLLQARQDSVAGSRSLIIDGGGQLRFSLTRLIAPPQAQSYQTVSGRSLNITRETSETLTLSYQLTPADAAAFAELLAELEFNY